MRTPTITAVALLAAVIASGAVYAEARFDGRVLVEWVSDGEGPDRDMRLAERFSFTDPAGLEWEVPEGSVVNGASIPRAFWTAVGPPFVGDYRRASVVHDYFCKTKERGWKAVHRMFYDAMLADGVEPLRAKVLYAAVYGGGPRWGAPRSIGGEVVYDVVEPELSAEEVESVEQWIESEAPSLEDIEERMQQLITD